MECGLKPTASGGSDDRVKRRPGLCGMRAKLISAGAERAPEEAAANAGTTDA